MTDEEKKPLPTFQFKDIPPVTGAQKIKLDCAEPVKTGISAQWNKSWYLWFGFVENTNVWEGRRPNLTQIENYTGKVIIFPSEKLNTALIAAANGNVGAEVIVKHEIKQNMRGGFISNYIVEKLSDGSATSGVNLSPYEAKLVNDAKSLMTEGRVLDEATFIKASEEDMYGGQISKARAIELYKGLQL